MTAPTQTQQPRHLTAAQMAALLALIQAQAAVRQQLTQTAVSAALAPLRAFTAWWDAAAVDRLIGQILKVVQPAQRQAARVTSAYIANTATIIGGSPVRPAPVVDITKLRRKMTEQLADELLAGDRRSAYMVLGDTHDLGNRDVDTPVSFGLSDNRDFHDPADAYGRVADGYRYAVTSRGDDPHVAQDKARVRIANTAETDVTLAVREQWQQSMFSLKGVTGYRRILHPELSKTGPCGLCVVAADRVYKKEDLLPLHNKCVCEVLPVYGRVDPGITLNGDDLRAVYEAAGGNTREHLRRITVALAEHGELGPVIVDAGQHYRSPEDVARTRTSDRATRERAILDDLLARFENTKYRVSRGEDLGKTLRWQAERIQELQRSLARIG